MLAVDKHVAIFNDLIRINNDRIAGYETALAHLPAGEKVLQELLEKLRAESRLFREALIFQVATLGGKVAADSTFSGKVFRTWMDFKNAVAGNDTQAILQSCITGEGAWQKAYEVVLNREAGLPDDSRQLITQQYNAGRSSAALLAEYRRMLAAT